MARVYRSNWSPEKLVVDFNHKQWRQDLASFIVSKLYWTNVRVGRARVVNKDVITKDSTREFEIYDSSNNVCSVKYSNKNKIIHTSHPELIQEYMAMRGLEDGH